MGLTGDIGPQIDETGWECFYVEAVMVRLGDLRKAAQMDRVQLRDLVRQMMGPFAATDYEIDQITKAVAAKLRDYVPPADSPPPQSRDERLYR